MFSYLTAVLLLLQTAYGLHFNNTAEFWDRSFTQRLEEFLEAKNDGISPQCMDHLSLYAKGLKLGDQWAIKMFDAGANRFPAGMLEGNVVDLGNLDECLNIQHQIFGKYCIGTTFIKSKEIQTQSTLAGMNSLQTVASTHGTISIYLARCFPDVCSTVEMQKVYTEIDFELKFSTDLCQTKATQPKFDFGSYVAICIFGLVLFMATFSTAFDITYYYLGKEPPHQILVACSAFTNGKQLIKTSNNSNDISCVHGIRVLSTMWVILFHRFYIQIQLPIRNFFHYPDWFKDETSMFMHSATLAVDTFFLLAGLFTAYNYMIASSKGVKFNILLQYIQRYLRLTPVLAIMVLYYTTLLKHAGSGPLWPNLIEKGAIEECKISWWRALLYIQNIHADGKPVCIYASWYLSVDMQLYILSPFLLIPLKRWPKLALLIIGFIAICSMVAGFITGWIYEINPYAFVNQNDKFQYFLWKYYYPTYIRAVPWLIGIAMGYLLFKSKDGNIDLLKRKVAVFILWAAALTLFYACVFAGHDLVVEEYNKLAASLHLALVRPVWAIALSWVIFACANGCGGPVNWFLSLPIFQVLSKLTYTLYLVHAVIIFTTVGQIRVPTLLNTFHMVYNFWGDFVGSLVMATVLALAVELPVMAIWKYLVQGSKT